MTVTVFTICVKMHEIERLIAHAKTKKSMYILVIGTTILAWYVLRVRGKKKVSATSGSQTPLE